MIELRVTDIPYPGLAHVFSPPGLRLVEKSAGAPPTTSVLVRGAAGAGKTTLGLAIAHALAKALHGIAVYVATETSLADAIDKASVLKLGNTPVIPYDAAKALPEGAVALAHLVVARDEAHDAEPSHLAKLVVDYAYELASTRTANAPVRAIVVDSFELPEGKTELGRSDLAAFVQSLESLGVSPVFVEEIGWSTSERLTFVVDIVIQLALVPEPPSTALHRKLAVMKSRYAEAVPGPHEMALNEGVPTVWPDLRAPEVSIARLPATGRDLFGREAELAWLDGCWKDGVRVASIVAFGGVGKSALVNAWLAKLRDGGWAGAERVYGWSFYSQGTDRLTSSDEFFAAALKSFGDPDPTQGSPWDKGERLAKLIRRERTLLVLDGVESLQWGPGVQQGNFKDPALEALVKELGAHNKGLCLITSRIALTDLEALTGDKVRALDLTNLSPEVGAELLRACGTKGTDEELREAAKDYKGHSLALTLLGSYLEEIAEGDIRRRREIGPLQEDERQGGHARRVMTAYEQWLGKPEAAILHMIGLFDRPADEDEIAALRAEPMVPGLTDALMGVGGREWNKAVAKLRRAGLLAAEQEKRLDAHPLVREHFGEQLKREQPEAWREGHRRLYEHLKKKTKELPETIEEMAPLYEAVIHGCHAGKNQEALDDVWWKRIRRENGRFSIFKLGAFGSEVAVLSAFFDPPWERPAPGLSQPWQALVLNEAGYALGALGRLRDAAGLSRLSMEMTIAQEDWENAAIAASNLSDVLQVRGELREALVQARKSVELADKSGDASQRMSNRTDVAAALHAMGLREEAAAQFEEAERMQKEMEPAYPLLFSLWGFRYCHLLLDQGRDVEVRERAAKALEVATSNHWLFAIALDHLSLGCAHFLAAHRGAVGDLAQATFHLKQAVDSLRRAGQQDYLPRGLLARAALHTHTRAFADARRDLDETVTLATRCGFRLHEADAHLAYARLCLAEGDPVKAREHLALATKIIQETGYHRRDSELAELSAACR